MFDVGEFRNHVSKSAKQITCHPSHRCAGNRDRPRILLQRLLLFGRRDSFSRPGTKFKPLLPKPGRVPAEEEYGWSRLLSQSGQEPPPDSGLAGPVRPDRKRSSLSERADHGGMDGSEERGSIHQFPPGLPGGLQAPGVLGRRWSSSGKRNGNKLRFF